MDTAKKYCDRIIGMKTGNIVFDDQPELLKDETARDIYGAEAEEAFEAAITSTSLGDNQERLIGNKKGEGLDW